jgi:hypothetical protein
MTKKCDACGALSPQIGIGSALLCRDCAPDVQEEAKTLRADGKPVNILHIAKRRFREEHSGGNFLIRDIPETLLTSARHLAVDRKCSLKRVFLDALESYIKQ